MSVFLPLVAVHLAWTAAAAVVITRRTRNPASAGVWLLLVALLPAVGSLLYVLAGDPEGHRRGGLLCGAAR